MTLWQDPPPQTRRQARESERAAAQQQADGAVRSRRAGTASPTTAGDIPDVNTSLRAQPADTAGSESAPDPDRAGGAGSDAQAQSGRPSVARPVPPRYEGVSFDTLVKPTNAAAASGSATPTGTDLFQTPPKTERPEPLTSPVAVVPSPPQPDGSAAGSPVPASGERMLTRRELRALQQAREADAANTSTEPGVAPTATESRDAPESASAPVSASVSPPALSAADRPAAEPGASAGRIDAIATPAAEPVGARPFADILAPPMGDNGTDVASAPEQPASVVYETQRDADALSSRAYTPPTGHWSIAAQEPDDDSDDAEVDAPGYARSRVSSGTVTTTNALILPIIPSVADATGPLTSTGEILVTGSIDLPRSLGATGTHSDRFDSSDIDHMFEQGEGEQVSSDAVPIRASRAVSTHTSTRDVITPRKHRGNKLPTVLAVTAAVLALGVVALLVAGYVFKVF